MKKPTPKQEEKGNPSFDSKKKRLPMWQLMKKAVVDFCQDLIKK